MYEQDCVNRPLPLAGTRILSVEQYGAGPYGTMFLAQLGAEVIKLEPPKGGDSSRQAGPFLLGADDSLFYQTFNLNKRSLTLDLKSPQGREILHRLVGTAAALTNNARGDQPAKLGLTYAALCDHNPAIVCVHASAYGRDNPRAAWPGYDYLMQAEAGFMAMTGEPDGPPTRFGLSMVDFITGTMLATACLAALLDARSTGCGRDMDVSLIDAALHQTSYPATWYLNEGYLTERATRASHPTVTPSQLFRTSDGWVFIMAQLPKFWTLLCDRLAVPQLAADPRFATVGARLEHRALLTDTLDRLLMQQPTAHWVRQLGGVVPVAPVHDLASALDNDFTAERAMIDTVAHTTGDLRVLANPIRVDGARLPNRAAPALGADTDALLGELGYDGNEVAALRSGGVV